MESEDVETESSVTISTEFAASLVQYMDYLIERRYYSSREEIVRQAVIDLFLDKFEISLEDLEPDLFDFPLLDEIFEDEDE